MLLGFSNFIDLDADIVSVVTMLGLALCIDYSLLLVARYREELTAGYPPAEAAERTWAKAGRTIAFSALIVISGLAGLFCFDEARLRAMAAAGISATVVALVSALTLTAALLHVFRRWIKPAKKAKEGVFFARLARAVQRRPLIVAVVTMAALAALGAPLLTATVKLPDMQGLPRSIESVRVADALASRYGDNNNPAIVVVARVAPSTLDTWAGKWRDAATAGKAEEVSPGLSRIAFSVAGDSQAAPARDLVMRMRADRPAGGQSWVGGDSAVIVDLREKLAAGLPYALGVIVLAMFVLLFLMTGSLVVPLKALLMNFVSLGASFGILAGVFEHGWLAGPLDTLTIGGLDPFVVLLVFAFGFGLSMDYEVFLLSRIKEQVDAGHSTEVAVQRGLQQSGRIITSAAALMLVVFGFFAAAHIGDIEQIGLGLFVAVLVDATIVRCLLVPATMSLLGRVNWWPYLRTRKTEEVAESRELVAVR
jgi:RND superfamily putative drug exporter